MAHEQQPEGRFHGGEREISKANKLIQGSCMEAIAAACLRFYRSSGLAGISSLMGGPARVVKDGGVPAGGGSVRDLRPEGSDTDWPGALQHGSSAHARVCSLFKPTRRLVLVGTAVSLLALLGYGSFLVQDSRSKGYNSSFLLEGYNSGEQGRKLGGELAVGCDSNCMKMVEERGIRSWHFWSDEVLLKTALDVKELPAAEPGVPRMIAFLFLTREGVTHVKLWERFFKGHNHLYSIYVHVANPGLRLGKTSPLFWGRQIPSETTTWGSADLVDAEKRLLANAYLDPRNERFILLSESCIPLRPFPVLYDFLISSPKSWVGCYNLPTVEAEGRWDEHFLPLVPRALFRKGSQWFELRRNHVCVVLKDKTYWGGAAKALWKQPEEHYIPSLFYLLGIHNEIWHATLTDVDWSRPEGEWGSHPHSYVPWEVTPDLIWRLRALSNNTFFARKFKADCADALLNLGKTVLGF